MNGPEHYQEAERLTNAYQEGSDEIAKGLRNMTANDLAAAQSVNAGGLALAQVHATLALAAATIDAAAHPGQSHVDYLSPWWTAQGATS